MKNNNEFMGKQILIVLLCILLYSIQLDGQHNYKFKKILPPGQWSEYSHDKSHHAVLLDEQGNTFIISQISGLLVIQKINAFGELLWAHPDEMRPAVFNDWS